MSVRKRKWTSGDGAEKEAWVVDYVDGKGVRRLKTFPRKKDADAFASKAHVEVREGTHVADSDSVTVSAAAALWIASGDNAGLERSTMDQRRQHVGQHIAPHIGETLLSKLTVPAVRAFEDRLRQEGRSPAMVRKVLTSLGSLLADAQERGLSPRNAVRDMRTGRKKGRDRQAEKRAKGRVQVGTDIPTIGEVRSLLAAVQGRWRPLILTAVFTGLRASELRGLQWSDVDFDRREIHVRRRADRYNEMGRPKSSAGERVVPIGSMVANTLREWKLACPKGELGLVFPNGAGKVESLANIVNRGLAPAQVAAGVTTDTGKRDGEGRPILAAKYTGMHALRHFYASWCINRPEDGGLGLPPKVVQERLGHSSIVMTMDVYGHLFPRGDHADELDTAEKMLLT